MWCIDRKQSLNLLGGSQSSLVSTRTKLTAKFRGSPRNFNLRSPVVVCGPLPAPDPAWDDRPAG